MFRILLGTLLLSLGMVSVGSLPTDFSGLLFMDNPKDFLNSEVLFTVLAGVGLPLLLCGFADTIKRK